MIKLLKKIRHPFKKKKPADDLIAELDVMYNELMHSNANTVNIIKKNQVKLAKELNTERNCNCS